MLQKLLAQPKMLQKLPNNIAAAELKRLQLLTLFEEAARQQGAKIVAGIDEAGRGPLAGPVVAAACIIPADYYIAGVNDSKKLTSEKRACIFDQMRNDSSIQYAVGIVASEVIDRINILQATIEAMLLAISQLAVMPDVLLVDGLHLRHASIPSQKIIKGDQKSQSIAAASIIAKETRDSLMHDYHKQWPHYGFDQHKGYGTRQHIEALAKYGPSPIHRASFKLKSNTISEK